MADLPAVAARYARHVNPSFIKLLGVLGYGRIFTRASGVHVWDDRGVRYLDLLSGYGSANLGHNHPRLIERLKQALDEEALAFSHVGPAPRAAELAEALAARLPAPLEVTLFAVGGGDAVEAAMKLARAATGRQGFVFAGGGFHGTTMATLSVGGVARMREPFGTMLAGCVEVPFGDLRRLEEAVKKHRPAAFVVEPIQAEAGVVMPPPGYLRGAAEVCRRSGALFVLDEIQTGLGRTGRMFALEEEGVVPDVVTLAKALSGGIVPVAAAVTSKAWFEKAYGTFERFDLANSTFAGNALSCAAGLATLEILDAEKLVANAAARGAELLAGLRQRLGGHPLVREVRGRGLLVAIELGPDKSGLIGKIAGVVSDKVFGQWAALKLLERGILCQPAAHAWNVLKIEPPLTVTSEHVGIAVESIAAVLDEYRGMTRLMADVAGRLGTQGLRGWSFP